MIAPSRPPDGRASAATRPGFSARLRHALPHLAMLLVSAFLYWSAGRIDAYTGGGSRIGPDAWPRAIIVFMGLLCAFEAGRRLLGRGVAPAAGPWAPAGPQAAEPKPAEPKPQDRRHRGMLLGGVLLVAAYVVAVPWLGFFLTTAAFLALFPWLGGVRRPLPCLAIGLVGSFVLVVLFMRIAYISLPLGAGPFRAVSIMLLDWIGVM